MGLNIIITSINFSLIFPIDSSFGQPFNQLATLSSGQGHGIISVYYYLRWWVFFLKKNAVHITYIENPPYLLCLPLLRHKFLFQFNFYSQVRWSRRKFEKTTWEESFYFQWVEKNDCQSDDINKRFIIWRFYQKSIGCECYLKIYYN